MYKQFRSIILASLVTVFCLGAVIPAFAGAEGRKNTAIVLTAATAYSYLHHKDRNALIGAVASAAAWKNYEDARKHESKQKARYYRQHHPRGHAYGYYKNHKHNRR